MKIEKNKIYNIDNSNIFSSIPPDFVDLIVTDPPYGVRKDEAWDDRTYFNEVVLPTLIRCREICPRVIWFAADKTLSYLLENRPDDLFRILVWEKPPGSQYSGASHNEIWYSNEFILLFGDAEDFAGKGIGAPMSFASYQARTIAAKKFGHKTVKPLDLIEWLIRHHSNAGDLVFDPYLGTGTTAEAARNLGRDYLGTERELKHFKTAKERLAQKPLFELSEFVKEKPIDNNLHLELEEKTNEQN